VLGPGRLVSDILYTGETKKFRSSARMTGERRRSGRRHNVGVNMVACVEVGELKQVLMGWVLLCEE
jgi:hypothetical protein